MEGDRQGLSPVPELICEYWFSVATVLDSSCLRAAKHFGKKLDQCVWAHG